MKVSIITATYNSAETIADTVESIRCQTYRDIEWIVVDGVSRDETLTLLESHSELITTLISEPDSGIYDALNRGINAATGEVIGFLHSDDLFAYPEAVADMIETLERNGTDAVYADLNYVQRADITRVVRAWKAGPFNRNKIRRGWMPPHPTLYMRRECYQRFGLFDLTYRIAADYDLILRSLWNGGLVPAYLPKVVINMRLGGESNASLGNLVVKWREDVRAIRHAGLCWPQTLLGKNLSKLPQFFKGIA